MLLELKEVAKGFGEGNKKIDVLSDINLAVKEGESIAIVGFTGSGKTTLIKLMAGLLTPDSGHVIFKGQPVAGPGRERGIVFQNYSLLPWLTVLHNVMLAVDEAYPEWTRQERLAHAKRYIAMVNLQHALNKRPAELSGGMRQRVSLARTLAMNPEMLLMDEPLGALDAITRASLQQEIIKIRNASNTTALLITNDVDEAILMADRVIPLNPGPNATLGPSFTVEIDRNANRTALNASREFIRLRNQVMEYLLDKRSEAGTRNSGNFRLPNISPVLPQTGFGITRSKAA
jgi:nitrate/nitrite transport system ATP-binding protein